MKKHGRSDHPVSAVDRAGRAAQGQLLAVLGRCGAESARAWLAAERAREERIEQALRDLVDQGLVSAAGDTTPTSSPAREPTKADAAARRR